MSKKWTFVRGQNATDMGTVVDETGREVMYFGDCECYYPIQGSPPEGKDMALMLAAPELLEALVHMVCADDAHWPPENAAKVRAFARATIAKATTTS